MDFLFLCFEPETFLSMFFWNHERCKCSVLLSVSLIFIVVSFLANSLNRIFSIKRQGRLFKTWPRTPGVYTNPAFIRGPAFIYQMHFSAIHFLSSVRISARGLLN